MKRFPCDGRCCRRSPLVAIASPIDGGQDCKYRDPEGKFDANSACRIMQDKRLYDALTPEQKDRFVEACEMYPEKWYTGNPAGEDGRACCWGRV